MATLPYSPYTHADAQVQPMGKVAPGGGPLLVSNASGERRLQARIDLVTLQYETEDSLLTGGTRSLGRRLLALNLEGSLRREAKMSTSGAATQVTESDPKVA